MVSYSFFLILYATFAGTIIGYNVVPATEIFIGLEALGTAITSFGASVFVPWITFIKTGVAGGGLATTAWWLSTPLGITLSLLPGGLALLIGNAWLRSKLVLLMFWKRVRAVPKIVRDAWTADPFKVLAIASAAYLIIRQVFKYKEWRKLQKQRYAKREASLDSASIDLLFTAFIAALGVACATTGAGTVMGIIKNATWVKMIFSAVVSGVHKVTSLFQPKDDTILPKNISHKGSIYELVGPATPGDPDVVVGRDGTVYQKQIPTENWVLKTINPKQVTFGGGVYTLSGEPSDEQVEKFIEMKEFRETKKSGEIALKKKRDDDGKGVFPEGSRKPKDTRGIGYDYTKEATPFTEMAQPEASMIGGFISNILTTGLWEILERVALGIIAAFVAEKTYKKFVKFWSSLKKEEQETLVVVLLGVALGMLYFYMVDLKSDKVKFQQKESFQIQKGESFDLFDPEEWTAYFKSGDSGGRRQRKNRKGFRGHAERFGYFDEHQFNKDFDLISDRAADLVTHGGLAPTQAMTRAMIEWQDELAARDDDQYYSKGHHRFRDEALKIPPALLEKLKREVETQVANLNAKKQRQEKALDQLKTQLVNVTENHKKREQHVAEQMAALERQLEITQAQLSDMVNATVEAEEWIPADTEEELFELNKDKFYGVDELPAQPKGFIKTTIQRIREKFVQGKQLAKEEVAMLRDYTKTELGLESKLPNIPTKPTLRQQIDSIRGEITALGHKPQFVQVPSNITDSKQKQIYVSKALRTQLNKLREEKRDQIGYGQLPKIAETRREAPQLGSMGFDSDGEIYYGVCRPNGDYYKQIGKVGKYLVTCKHYDDPQVGSEVLIGKFQSPNPAPLHTEKVKVLYSDDDKDLVFTSLPKFLMVGEKSLKPFVLKPDDELTVAVKGVATEKDKKFRKASGLANGRGEHYAESFIGYSGCPLRTQDNRCPGVHNRGPQTDRPDNREPNRFYLFSSEDVERLTGDLPLN